MRVKNKTLLLLAGLVWLAAGYNIMRIGFMSYINYISIGNIILSLLVFLIFWFMIFSKLVKKHTIRIIRYETKQYFWNFFDGKSFWMMAFMMTFGIAIRMLQLAPLEWIAVFYSGLGAALFLAGLYFMVQYITTQCVKERK